MGRSDSAILHKMMDSDSPNVLHPRVWALSDRRKRPPGASWAFQMLQKASHLPHGFAIWQNRAPYGSKSCPGLSMVSSFQKCCCGRSQMQVLAPQGPASVLDDGHFTSSLPHSRMSDMGGCSTLPLPAHPCLAPATGLLQELRCRGYAARAMLYGAMLPTRISMLQLLHP